MRAMNNRPDNDIRRAIDAQFSGFEASPIRENRILEAAIEKGEKKVKKKLSVGLALALALLLVSATAMAGVLTDYFGLFAQLEESYGEYEAWPASAKVELVTVMMENGMDVDQDKAAAMAAASTQAEQDALADEILDAYFDGMHYIDTHNIFTREWGPQENWTEEQYRLYTDLMKEHNWWGSDWPEYFTPSAADFSESQAVARAREALLAKFDVSAEELDALKVNARFMNHVPFQIDEKNQPVWWVEIGGYRAVMRRNGEMLVIGAPRTRDIPWGSDTLAGSVPAEIHDYDLSLKDALQFGLDTLTEVIHVPDDQVGAYTATAQFIYNENFCSDEPVWLVVLAKDDAPAYKVLVRWDGAFISWASWGKEFLYEGYPRWVEQKDAYYPHGVYNEKGVYFDAWTHEEQAAFSEKMIPIVEQLIAENPYFADQQYNDLYWATRHVYGVPGAQDIPESEALRAAQEACVAAGANASTMNDRTAHFLFDVTDPAHPRWIVRFTYPANQALERGDLDLSLYRVVIDARTAQPLDLTATRAGGDIPPDFNF